jgi:membrane associated rhomboid family serine protease
MAFLIPVKDDNPLHVIRFQVVTAILIVVNVVLFALSNGYGGEEAIAALAVGFGVIPVEVLGQGATTTFNPVAEPLTLISYAFLHASWLHLISNMVILWIVGDNVEDAYGHVPFLLFYIASGIVAALGHIYFATGSQAPLIGASGAVAGVMGAYLMLYPKARVLVLLGFVFPVRIPAFILLLGWLALQFYSLYDTQDPNGPAVAWWAHIAGFVFGAVVTLLLKGFSVRQTV